MDAKFYKLSNEINHNIIIRTHYYDFYKKLGGVSTFSERNLTLRHFHGFIHSIRNFSRVIEPSENDGHNFKPLKDTSIMRRRQKPSKIESSFCVGVCGMNLISMDIIWCGFSRCFPIWKRKINSPTHFGENRLSKLCGSGFEKFSNNFILIKFAIKFWLRKCIYYICLTHAWVINRSF